jgi:hypothetical protein
VHPALKNSHVPPQHWPPSALANAAAPSNAHTADATLRAPLAPPAPPALAPAAHSAGAPAPDDNAHAPSPPLRDARSAATRAATTPRPYSFITLLQMAGNAARRGAACDGARTWRTP